MATRCDKYEKRKCVRCGKSYVVKSNIQKYCSDKCSKAANRRSTCKFCGKIFKNPGQKKLYCNKKCRQLKQFYSGGSEANKKYYKDKLEKEALNIFSKRNIYTDNLHHYNDKVIDYDKSPDGKAYIGLAKGSLIPNDNGIGFKGVKIQSANRELIQCNECGKWYRAITAAHLRMHNMTVEEYKKKYELSKHTGLVSDVTGNILSEVADKNRNCSRTQFGKKHIKNNTNKNGRGGQSMEYKNNRETCPLQLKESLINYINRYNRLPNSYGKRQAIYSKVSTLKRRFGSLNEAFKFYGLPTRYKLGGKTQYVFSDDTTYLKQHNVSYMELYRLMLKKCPVLTTDPSIGNI